MSETFDQEKEEVCELLREAKEKIQQQQQTSKEQRDKIDRLTELNTEMQDLIQDERQLNQEENDRMEKEYKIKLKKFETKQIVYRNKLISLAKNYGIKVSPDTDCEDIVDQIIQKACHSDFKPAEVRHDKPDPSPLKGSSIETTN